MISRSFFHFILFTYFFFEKLICLFQQKINNLVCKFIEQNASHNLSMVYVEVLPTKAELFYHNIGTFPNYYKQAFSS